MGYPHFSEGDVVRLRSGGKKMTVAAACYEEVVCVRYDYSDAEPFTDAFSPAMLELVQAANAGRSTEPRAAGLQD